MTATLPSLAKMKPNPAWASLPLFDRECCVLYKAVMDELIGPDGSAVVMSGDQRDPLAWSVHLREKVAEEKLLDRFPDPVNPLYCQEACRSGPPTSIEN
jgi:type I restriction enzyme, R subunit